MNGLTPKIVSTADMMMQFSENSFLGGNELPSVWKKVVSKVHSYKNESEDSEKRMPIGERLAGNTRVVDLKNGILLIETDHSGWIQYLKMYQKFIINGLKRELPELKITSFAFRIAGSQAALADVYNEQISKMNKEFNDKLDKQEKEIDSYYKKIDSKKEKNGLEQKNSASESKLPPELLEKFASMKESLLTNSKN